MERHRTGGNYLSEDVIAGRPYSEVKRRAHRVNVRVDEDLYRRLRAEAEASKLSLAAALAPVLGVSERTVRRDLRTLCNSTGPTAKGDRLPPPSSPPPVRPQGEGADLSARAEAAS